MLQLTPSQPRAARDISIHHVTAELARTVHRFDLDRALRTASYTLDMHLICVSVLAEDGVLREVIATGAALDPVGYRLAEFPATAAALRDGVLLEVYRDQVDAEPEERALLEHLDLASLLLVPLIVDGKPCGVLEMFRDRPRRWSARDVQDARILAQHLAHALDRITIGS
jgi:GAF domain-containing protein